MVFPLIVDASPINPPSTTNLLRQFREQWQNELIAGDVRGEEQQNANPTSSLSLTNEERASAYFTEGAELERLGKVFEAMHLYRRAVQLVPDIEQRIYDKTQQKQLKEEVRVKSNKTIHSFFLLVK